MEQENNVEIIRAKLDENGIWGLENNRRCKKLG